MVSKLSKPQILKQLQHLPDWKLKKSNKEISRKLKLKDFMAAVRLINQIAKLAEAMDHHPNLHLAGYHNLEIRLSTHSIGGLSKLDFILATKIDRLI